MVKRKSTKKRAAVRTVYKAAPRKRATNKSGVKDIPGAAATAGLILANADNIGVTLNRIGSRGLVGGMKYAYTEQLKEYISADQIIKDGIYTAGGYFAGYVAKKYMPSVIRTPMGHIAKKIPKVIE